MNDPEIPNSQDTDTISDMPSSSPSQERVGDGVVEVLVLLGGGGKEDVGEDEGDEIVSSTNTGVTTKTETEMGAGTGTVKVLSEEEEEVEKVRGLRERKIKAINARIESLSTELADVEEKLAVVTKELKSPAAPTVKQHIHLLHKYNEIRDIGQGLLGMVAENRHVRISDVYEEFGVGFND